MVGDVVEGGGDDLVARPDAGCFERNVDGRRPRVGRRDVSPLETQVFGDPVFEVLGRGAHAKPPHVQRVGQVLEGVDPNVRLKDGYGLHGLLSPSRT